MNGLVQKPLPGEFSLRYRGDVQRFYLQLPGKAEGKAWLRTNIGRAATRRLELVNAVEKGKPVLARDWHDVVMRRLSDTEFVLDLPLTEVGVFEAKAFFLPSGEREPVWPEGGNAYLKVEPAAYCCANTMYTAFVRQFGPNRAGAAEPQTDECIDALESVGYTVIPPSGTFRDLIRNIDVILDRMQFRILQLLPIHPTPTTFARMGRFGSPFAVIDFWDIDPALAEFDRQTTPLQQFTELVNEVHKKGAKLFLDVPVNHTGWGSKLQGMHPDWFERNHDSTFRSPGAWGVTWEDLSQLDYGQKRLWVYLAEVFTYWCSSGVDGFRCDAGYMVPEPVWHYVVAKVRKSYPDTIFMLEGLGGKVETTKNLMSRAGLDWAYSELFQQYTREQFEAYLPGSLETSSTKGMLMSFAETHDNNRLAATSRTYSKMRTTMTAMVSDAGGFGITNGVEWFADSKVDVHGAPSLRWDSKTNQIDHIARLNSILGKHPAFRAGVQLSLVHTSLSNAIALRRKARESGEICLVLVNLDAENASDIQWRRCDFDVAERGVSDLLTGRNVALETDGESHSCSLDAGEVICLCAGDCCSYPGEEESGMGDPAAVREQQLKAKAADLFVLKNGLKDAGRWDQDASVALLGQDPVGLCEQLFGLPIPLARWRWPVDATRVVMVPPRHMLLVSAPCRFRVRLSCNGDVLAAEESVLKEDGTWFALILPVQRAKLPAEITLSVSAYEEGGVVCRESGLLYLADYSRVEVNSACSGTDALALDQHALCTNGRGGMSQVQGAWGVIRSRYDAFLAGNLDSRFPVDRRVMLTRCRVWLQYRGYSQEIGMDCLERFSVMPDGCVRWDFQVPAGLGKLVPLTFRLAMIEGSNRIELALDRKKSKGAQSLSNESMIRLVLRPDLEDRGFHEVTKAYMGPEELWPGAAMPMEKGLSFSPGGEHCLCLLASDGEFVSEPEWSYCVPLPFDGERGLDDSTDLFSPGYFAFDLSGDQGVVLSAEVLTGNENSQGPSSLEVFSRLQSTTPAKESLAQAAERSMSHFVVQRTPGKTVIAGYPWFLDWGRDTLICLRGLVHGDYARESREILEQFASLESNGTLPNMLRGADSSNRDTSDAPLWFFVACEEVLNREGSRGFLDTDCGGRTILEVMESIASAYIAGTPNGIVMDPASGLIFSPSHFTWMDTNYPAGTPREGYPVEIQALWYAALRLLGRVSEDDARWLTLADKVKASIVEFYVRDGVEYLSDCLHCGPGTGAADAVADDALRPNQLLAITLGAVGNLRLCKGILSACEELLVPGGIRSLADRRIEYELPVFSGEGTLLNDPHAPYQGKYTGDEDACRKPAYHNGTAWTWLFPSYAEALVAVYGEHAKPAALAVLGSSAVVMNRGCLGNVPEILDGDAPHLNRGCGAQAWGATELYRVLSTLSR